MLMLALAAAAAIPPDALRAIAAANNAWLSAMKRQDAAAIVEPYADDAVFVAATGESARGRPAIEQMMRDRFAKAGRVMGGSLIQDGTAAAGSMIYEWGHAELDVSLEGQPPTHVRGRYLTVWQRVSGQWRIVRNLSLPD
jgi:uncharacterized protein (TIGR02246 family)